MASGGVAAAPITARGRRTRESLVQAARDVFEAKGFSDTTMSDLADAAGVSHGTVYTYFPAKEAVLAAVCNAVVGEVFAAVRVPEDLRADPVTRIAEGNRRYLRAYAAHARMLEVVEQAATTDEYFRELVDGLRGVFVEKAKSTLRRFQADGLADATLDPDIAGPALVGMVESFARRWYVHDGTFDAEQVVDTLTRMWARAIGLPVEHQQSETREQP
ncbi:MAG: TetR/AcrR family transcriptional regulator [Actinomycetia bacterium]|nr:TetR/AcrR family transcriptional regulator [Actinomycetes bacterium]